MYEFELIWKKQILDCVAVVLVYCTMNKLNLMFDLSSPSKFMFIALYTPQKQPEALLYHVSE